MRVAIALVSVLLIYSPARAELNGTPATLCRLLAMSGLTGELTPDNVSDTACTCTIQTCNGETTTRVDVNLSTLLDCDYWQEIDKIRRETGYVGWDSMPVPQRDPF